MNSAVIVLVLTTLCSGTTVTSRSGALQHDLDESLKERPVTKVINMLKDMKAEIEAEMEDDKEVYEKVKCWCDTGIKEKTAAIATGEAQVEALTADIEEYMGKIEELKALLGNTKKEKNKNFDDLNKASAMRMKDNAEFHEREKELMMAIASARDALTVLARTNPDPTLAQLRKIAKTLGAVPENYLAESSITRDQVGIFKSFLQGAATATSPAAFLQSRNIPGSFQPSGGAIVGILKQMKEDFEKDLVELTDGEKKIHQEFVDLKAATEGEMDANTKKIGEADEDFAKFTEMKAQAEEELEDTEKQLALDKEFLANLKKKCDENEKEFAKRSKAKLDELQGVADTIGFLNSDEAHAMFDKTVNSMFIQKSITYDKAQEKMKRRKVIQSLEALAIKTQSPRIILLVTKAHLDAFTEVKAEIDKMIAELKQVQADEVKKRDWCIAELNKNELSLEAKYDEQTNLQSKIDDLTAKIDQFKKDIKAKTEEIASTQVEMKRGSEDREAENSDYQQAVMDQKITQQILTKALDRMKETYALLQHKHKKAPGAPHIQTSGTDTEPGSGPARFAESKKNAGGAKVIKMIEDVINESKATEAEAIAAEQDAQQAYENYMKDSNTLITELSKAIANLTADMGSAKEELVATKEALAATNVEIQDLEGTKASLHKECDFLLKNFEVRQSARQAEMDGLAEAKAILSGA